MKKPFTSRAFTKNAIAKLVVGLLFAALSVPARGEDEGSKKATPPDQPPARYDSAQPVRSTSTPSLEDVMVLLQEQGQELETLRSQLREQKELTAAISAKINATIT